MMSHVMCDGTVLNRQKAKIMKIAMWTKLSICIGMIAVLSAEGSALERGPIISGLKLLSAKADLMRAGEDGGNVIEFQHDSPVPIKVFMKLPDAEWEQIYYSEPAFEGHTLHVSVPAGVEHAWFRIAADYEEIMEDIAENTATEPEEYSALESEEFEELLTFAGYEYVDMGHGMALLYTDEAAAGSTLTASASDNNHAMATPDPGHAKFFWVDDSSDRVATWILSNSGERKSYAVLPNGAPSGWEIIGNGDVNDDGIDDLLWRNTTDGRMAVWFMTADGQQERAVVMDNTAPIGWDAYGVCDVDGSGGIDIIWLKESTGQIAVWFMGTDGQRDSATIISNIAPTGWSLVGVCDVDHADGGDLLWLKESTGQLAVWFLGTDGQRKSAVVMNNTAPSGWVIAALGDINNSGGDDILWRNEVDGRMAVWFLTTGGQRDSAVIMNNLAISGWNVCGLINIDNTAGDDIMWRYTPTDQLAVWFMSTAGQRTNAVILSALAPSTWDIDGMTDQ